MRIQLICFLVCASAALFTACGDTDGETPGTQSTSSSSSGAGTGGAGTGGAGTGGNAAAICTSKTEVACSDAVFQQMNFQKDIAPGLITNEVDGKGFRTITDAKAGGFGSPDPDSYVYGKFTPEGLKKVEISDEDAMDSMDWDIAFRRYVVRLNSASSGPSCVSAARIILGSTYEDLAAVPLNLTQEQDLYFSAPPDCMLIQDDSGLPGSPATALSKYWLYENCMKMSGNVFVVELADGHHLKLTVDQYYEDAAVQEQCNTIGTVPMGSVSAVIHMRWAYLD